MRRKGKRKKNVPTKQNYNDIQMSHGQGESKIDIMVQQHLECISK